MDANYLQTDYLSGGLADRRVYALPLAYTHPLGLNAEGIIGVRWRGTEFGTPGLNTNDYAFSLGYAGGFDGKPFNDSISIGLVQRQGPAVTGGDRTAVGLDASFTDWGLFSSDFSYTLKLRNDFATAANGQTQQVFSPVVTAHFQFNPIPLGVSAGVGYDLVNYAGSRRDDFWTAHLDVEWTVARNWTLIAGYKYNDNGSSAAGFSFSESVLSVTLGVHF